MIVSPMNYIGNKRRVVSQLLKYFPCDINNFVDLFAGGCTVGINSASKNLFFNDRISYLVDFYNEVYDKSIDFTLNYIECRIKELSLSKVNKEGYLELRSLYNKEKKPLDLFVLAAFSFNHQIRFNNNHEFNNPFGANRSAYNERMKNNLIKFVTEIKKRRAVFLSKDYKDFDFEFLGEKDFVYCDPPYLITNGVYNDGNRGFGGWSHKDEEELLLELDKLNLKGVKFSLSNVLLHKGKENILLKNWLIDRGYSYYVINSTYSNSSYNTKREESKEVLIVNY